MSANKQLSLQKPAASPENKDASDSYKVNFAATTGKNNRWHTEMAKPVIYGNRARQDELLLTYTSPPLPAATEITGYPQLTLYLSADVADCAIFAYLEEVDEQNYVRYITEGQLRLLHRKISDAQPPYASFGPHHSFKRQDSQPLPLGQIVEVSFALLPTSVLIQAGRRIRLAIAGHDSETFGRIPAAGNPTITIARSQLYASFIELPVIS